MRLQVASEAADPLARHLEVGVAAVVVVARQQKVVAAALVSVIQDGRAS